MTSTSTLADKRLDTPFGGRLPIDGTRRGAADEASLVCSRNVDTCLGAARGTVRVNTFLEAYAALPFGGCRESGLGREPGRQATENDTETQTQTLHVHLGARTSGYVPR